MTQPLKSRFAPSPTGLLHLGNVRTALFNALLARRHGGVFLLRIEDTDQQRSREEYTESLEQDLLWLGLRWQEGPSEDQGHGPYRQSLRSALYGQYYDLLEQRGRAYFCFCSEQELKLSRKRQLAAGQPPRYSGKCAHMDSGAVAARLAAGERPTLRFRVPASRTIEFTDLVRGSQQFLSDDIGDFIIRRADGTPAFFFCNAIDDAAMGVTHVLRGEDHLANTPRQIMLLNALDLPVPEYGHISMIVGSDGAPLSKRHGSRSLRELRETGYLPEAVVNYLARLGHHYESGELLDMDRLAGSFDFDRLGRAPARYDAEQLAHWQREAVGSATASALWDWMAPHVHDLVPAEQRDSFVEAVRGNVVLPEHAATWARVLYQESIVMSYAAREVLQCTDAGFFEAAAVAVESGATDFSALTTALKSATGAKGRSLFQPLRAALTGELDGPEMARIVPLIGAKNLALRLVRAAQLARSTL